MSNLETKSITCFDLWSYLQEIQSAILEGYRLSESNEHFPQGYVGLYTCVMVRDSNSYAMRIELTDEQKKELTKVIEDSNEYCREIVPVVAKEETNVAQSETPVEKPKVQRKSKAKEV